MAIARLKGNGIEYPRRYWTSSAPAFATSTLNAATEKQHFVGYVHLEGGADGGSKTMSSSGGKIFWRTGNVLAFADAGTNIRIGLQDANVTAVPVHGDDTFDVQADLVGNVDTLVSNTAYETAMESGTKTVSHGDLLVVAFEMTARAGSDSVAVSAVSNIWHTDASGVIPGGWFDDGSPAASLAIPVVGLLFDDGSMGWLSGGASITTSSSKTYNVDTAGADEYGNIFIPEFDIVVCGASMSMTLSGDAEVCLYSDPLGTPSLLEAISLDASGVISTSRPATFTFSSEHYLRAGKEYAITLRPTTTTSNLFNFTGSELSGKYFKAMGMDENSWYAVERLNNSGAFSVSGISGADKDRRFHITTQICGIRTTQGSTNLSFGIN